MRIIPNKGLTIAAGGLLLLAACARTAPAAPILTTVYPAQFLAQRLTGATVVNLAPAGGEPHDLELSPRQIDQVQDAGIVYAWSPRFQPAVDDALRARTGPSVTLTDTLSEPARAQAGRDPHVWLDPIAMQSLANAMKAALSKRTPAQESELSNRLRALDDELGTLDADYRTGLASCEHRVIVTSHEAFGWLAQRYGLVQFGIAGIDPENEPSAQRIAEIADTVRRQKITTIFTEGQVSPRIAETIAREADGARVETLSTLESLTPEQVNAGADYFSLMRDNLAKLRAALRCS